MENNYWFSLCASVFIWRKKEKVLFYDSNTFISQLYHIDNKAIDTFIIKLSDINHLHCVEITPSELAYIPLKIMIQRLTDCGMGQLIDQDGLTRKPIQFPPLLNLQAHIDRLKDEKLTDLTIGEHILENLHEIKVMLPENADTSFIHALVILLDALTGSYTSNILISGYHPQMNKYTDLWQKLHVMPIPKTFIFNVREVSSDIITGLKSLDISNVKVHLVYSKADFDIPCKPLVELWASLSIPTTWEFLIEDVSDYDTVQTIVSTCTLPSEFTSVTPCYNGNNLPFFEQHIYLSEEDIKETEYTKRHIFANQALNTNHFGKLTITPDGKVYANLFHQSLGNVHDDIRELVYKEMTTGCSWLQTRNMEPCTECVYQWLCPSPSDYEYAIGRPNLCTVTT